MPGDDLPLPLTADLKTWCDWWLRIGCGSCRRSVDHPLRLMAKRHGGHLRLRDIAPRLRCKTCGAKPVEVILLDDPQLGAPGFASDRQPVQHRLI